MTELLSTEEVKEALNSLKELNEIRKQISQKLGSISVKYQLREKVLSNLYVYYEMVADDYYSLIDRVLRSPEAIELLYEGLLEQKEKLQTEMDRLKEILEAPIKLKDMKNVFEKIDDNIYYRLRRYLVNDGLKRMQEKQNEQT
ncbi:MAG: hypothetical protein KatS3mg068_1996 [Candidatus Sericytochromatia bacterium]|nr:MAG: hypothetical protein KatS3mg068_1996 [Candidatus Sericytochromatia bacterium]